MTENKTEENKVISTRIYHKKAPNGMISRTYTFEDKILNGNRFVQITLDKPPFGNKAPERKWITFDPFDLDFWKHLDELKKSVK